MSKIKKLTVVSFIFNASKHSGDLFAASIVAEYESGRIFQQTYYEERDIPFTYRDYMKEEWCISEKERSKPGEYLRQYIKIYQKGE